MRAFLLLFYLISFITLSFGGKKRGGGGGGNRRNYTPSPTTPSPTYRRSYTPQPTKRRRPRYTPAPVTPSPTTPSPTTPSPTTPSPTSASPTAASSASDLCGCFDVSLDSTYDLYGKVCYTYSITRISDADICKDEVDYIAIDSGDECPVDLEGKIVSSSGCKRIDDSFENLVSGVQCEFGDSYSGSSAGKKSSSKKSSSKKSSGKKSTGKKKKSSDDDRRRRRLGGYGGSKKSSSKKKSSGKKSSGKKSSSTTSDTTTFTICFDDDAVSGTRDGIVEIGLGDCNDAEIYTCDPIEIPDFCDDTTTTTTKTPVLETLPPTTTTTRGTTAGPTTSEPTSDAPTTADPTSAIPTTASPTTADPTSSSPTTSVPTSDAPTTSDPTSAAPTTADPTSASPTTSDPTSASPTTADPTTADPTSASPTTTTTTTTLEPTEDPTTTIQPTASPSTDQPTTSDPTTASPTTADPTSASPTTSDPTTADPTSASPTTSDPTSASPTSASPTTSDPTSASPTTAAPTTSDPTSAAPTTSTPTTSDPTSAAPTTSDPTTANPTSSSPTTSDPTTAVPTTATPTTSQPTSASPTTSDPTTAQPTTAQPSFNPTEDPTTTLQPTASPSTDTPTTSDPTTADPTSIPTQDPTTTLQPTASPSTDQPTTSDPTTAQPTRLPSTDPTQPSASPTEPPTFEVCNTEDSIDLTFLLDESGSVSEEEWDDIVSFVDRLIRYDVPPDSYVAMFEYAALPGFQQILDFDVRVGDDREYFGQELAATRWTAAGVTETWDAVNRVLDFYYDYNTECNNPAATFPYRTSCNRQDFLIIITDGAPTGQSVCPDMIDRLTSDPNLSHPVDIILILIDADDSSNFNVSEVDCLDIVDNKQDVIKVTDFSEAGLIATELQIREKICNGELPVSEGPEYEVGPWVYDDGSIGLGPVPTGDGSGGGGDRDRAEVGEEVAHDTEHQIAETTSKEALMWEIPTIIGAIIVLLIICVGLIYYRKYRQSKGQSFKDIAHITQISVSDGDKETGKVSDVVDDVCDSAPVSPAATSPEEEIHVFSPDINTSPDNEQFKMQNEINSIYADINV